MKNLINNFNIKLAEIFYINQNFIDIALKNS